MPGADILSGYFPRFLLILLRSSVFLAFLPILGSKTLPATFRIGLAVAIAALLTPVVDLRPGENDAAILVLREVVLGMVLGLAVRFVFFGIEIAGQMISDSMGLSIATVFNPEMGQSTEIARLLAILATLLFLVTDVHHDLIALFVRSYDLVPVGTGDVRALVGEGIALTGKVFVLAIKLGAPVVVGMVTLNLLLGFVTKATPQINIFFISFPLYILLGFLILMLALPAYVAAMGGSFGEMRSEMERVLSMARR
ncbi:MAG: flagellar biosynthetic protein FliR [Deltaproteobacteria bacterium]|nr:flagellar biosynthetic protein FliR [Deltaproteobacteria bacterium]